MKRLLFFLSLCFICTAAVTEQISINWGADNQLYTTTTCEIGDNVILPSAPTKRGYTFRGWKKDSFNRGTWANWQEVPNDENSYPEDFYGNRNPVTNDYMVVADVSLYPVDPIIVEKENTTVSSANPIQCIVKGIETSVYYKHGTELNICNNKISVKSNGNDLYFYANTDLYYNGTLLHQGDLISNIHWNQSFKRTVSLTQIIGTWQFKYHGIWEVDGKNGWKPETQITE